MTYTIGQRVSIHSTHQVGTIVRVRRFGRLIFNYGVETEDGHANWYPPFELESGYDLRPDIARLPVRLATVNGERVQ